MHVYNRARMRYDGRMYRTTFSIFGSFTLSVVAMGPPTLALKENYGKIQSRRSAPSRGTP